MAEDNSTIKWLAPIEEIPKKAVDPLAAEVMRRFNGAVAHQSGEEVNGKPLRTVLQESWEQVNGLLSCEDRQRAEALGVDVHINLTALKTGIANAYLNDAMTSGTSQLPWTISATPRPDISVSAKDELLANLKQAMQQGMITDPQMLVELIRQAKKYLFRRETEKAEKSAKAMELLIQDQCTEGGFHRALTDFLHYFTTYPYAVFTGPYVTRAPRLTWGKLKPRMATEVFPTFRAVSPFDFCYSADSPDTQRGTCVFTRTYWTRKQLLDAAKLKAYIQSNVLDVLKDVDEDAAFQLGWLSHAPDAVGRDLDMWRANTALLEVLTHYGVMSGRELRQYGFNSLEDTDFYNCEIAMTGHRIIKVAVIGDSRLQTRPVYTASFYRTGGDRIAGDGIAQRLRSIERAYISSLQYLLRNAANASAPLCEADYKRLAKYMGDEDLGTLVPGTLYLVDSDVSNSNNPAMRFFNIPSNIPAYAQLLTMFMELADRVTNIPASLHGEAVGSGAMRTFRGMSLLQGNATKAFQAAVANIADTVFNPLGQYLYNLNMLYSPDIEVKGDSQIVTLGAEGILQKEMDKQSAIEILQVLGAVGAQLGGMINLAPVVGWGVQKLMGTMGVPDDILDAMMQPPPMPPQGQGGSPEQQGISGGNQNPNPDTGNGEGLTADLAVGNT